MSTDGRGIDLIIGAREQTTWGTALSVDHASAELYRPILGSFQHTRVMPPMTDASHNATAANNDTDDTGRIYYTWQMSLNVKYQGMGLIQSAFFGTSAVSGATNFTHSESVADDNGQILTLAWYDGVDSHELDSCIVTGVTYNWSSGNWTTVDIRGIARNLTLEGPGTTVTGDISGGFATATENSTIEYVQLLNSTQDFQFATQGGVLADIETNSAQLVLEREYPITDTEFSTSTAPYMRAPCSSALTASGSMQLPYGAVTYADTAITSGTLYEWKFNIQGSAGVREHGVWLPSLKFTDRSKDAGDKGPIPLNLSFVAEKAVTVPSWDPGPPDIAHPSLQMINQTSGAYLT